MWATGLFNNRRVSLMIVPSQVRRGIGVVLLLVSAATLTFGQQVKVRLIHAKTGKPLIGQEVKLTGADVGVGEGLKAQDIRFELKAKTGQDGVALFPLPMAARSLLVEMGTIGCSSHAGFLSAVVATAGVVTENVCNGHKQFGYSPTPGEIVMFELPDTRWERFKRQH